MGATFVKAAQKNIYKTGKTVEYVSQKGKRAGQTLSKLDRTVPADENDEIFIAKGESYYWWEFQYSPKRYSKTPPKRSQLTQSSFLSELYSLEERIEEASVSTKDEFDDLKSDLISDIETLKDECQEKLDNMPEQLQSAPTGELLQERVDGLESWVSDIENVECDYDEDELREEIKEENEGIGEEDLETELSQKIEERCEEAISELQGTSAGL